MLLKAPNGEDWRDGEKLRGKSRAEAQISQLTAAELGYLFSPTQAGLVESGISLATKTEPAGQLEIYEYCENFALSAKKFSNIVAAMSSATDSSSNLGNLLDKLCNLKFWKTELR